MKLSMMVTAKDVGEPGWDPQTGAGVVRAVSAFEHCVGAVWARGSAAAGGAAAGVAARPAFAQAAQAVDGRGAGYEELASALDGMRRELLRQQQRLDELDLRYGAMGRGRA